MNESRQLHDLLLYAGVNREEYSKLLPSIRRENLELLKVFSNLAAIMFFLLFIVSMLSVGFFTMNGVTYFLSAVAMVAILWCATYFVPKRPAGVMILVYVFEILLYAFGMRISMLHAEKPAVSAVAFLLVSPLLFYDRPVRLCAMNAISIALFCVIVVGLKDPEVAQVDVWNMITFGIVAMVVTVFIMSVKIRELSQSRKVEYLSQTDLLTGAKNRNHYESRLQEYPKVCTTNLTCVFGDVNGLHEMNNREGHQAGDTMLREVASELQRCFGPEDTYRIGGDEFVAFRVDGDSEQLRYEMERMGQRLKELGYNVSFGIATWDKAERESIDIYEFVKEAENSMYAAKRAFYSDSRHNRRRRSEAR